MLVHKRQLGYNVMGVANLDLPDKGAVGDWVDVMVPGHGPITDKRGVQLVKAYWEYNADKIQTRYVAGMSSKDAAYDIVRSEGFVRRPFADWNSPELLMTNAHTIYRHLEGRIDLPGERELLYIVRKRAMLAHTVPDAQFTVMRKR